VCIYRSVSLTSVFCKQMWHLPAGYLREEWEKFGWLYEDQHGVRPGYSCENQLVAFCQDIADSLDEGVRTVAIIIDLIGFEGSCTRNGISLKVSAESYSRWATFRESQSNCRSNKRERITSSIIPSLC
jgi:hypothetical protein